jgi:hypothetical protein
VWSSPVCIRSQRFVRLGILAKLSADVWRGGFIVCNVSPLAEMALTAMTVARGRFRYFPGAGRGNGCRHGRAGDVAGAVVFL